MKVILIILTIIMIVFMLAFIAACMYITSRDEEIDRFIQQYEETHKYEKRDK